MTPTLSIRALHLYAETARGPVGRRLDFGTGLNILRADNTSGKSTALMAIIYALGLEGMLGPSGRIPLAHAMTDRVDIAGTVQAVTSSGVSLEIANGAGEIITVSRAVKDALVDRHLVTVHTGPAITAPGDYRVSDYFVRRRGGAQNEAGFHRFFANFLGLDLPRVPRLDGSEGLLYLEAIFPYFFVEQKHGWASIQARIPTYLGIRDVQKRTAEYVLGLSALDRARARQRIRSNMAALEATWQDTNRSAAELARLSQVVLVDAPVRISRGFDAEQFRPSVAVGNEWLALDTAVASLRTELEQEQGTPQSVGEAVEGIEANLPRLERALRETLAVAASLAEERDDLSRQREQLSIRLEALSEDLQRHQDAEVLRHLGSRHAQALLADHVCPTCHQELADGADISAHAMTAAENIEYIRRQIATFEASRADVERVLDAVSSRQVALAGNARQLRFEIRASRDALSSTSATPSAADVARRLTLETRIEELGARAEEFAGLRAELTATSEQWAQQKAQLDAIGNEDLSGEDRVRLAALQASVRQQLGAYGFGSLPPGEIDIDLTSYRPTHEGFDLGFDLSASDMIRVIWAYLFGLLNVSRVHPGSNHLGLLIFDEPRQQETARASYQELLKFAADAGAAGSQVIFATSEPESSLEQLLGGSPHNLLSLASGEKLLRPA